MGALKHTPGPWNRNIKPARKYNVIYAGRNTHICALSPSSMLEMTDEEIEANCDLIKTAPEMLAILKRICQPARNNGSDLREVRAEALRIIRRAEGRER